MLSNNIQGISNLRQIANKLQFAFKNIGQLCTTYIKSLEQNQKLQKEDQSKLIQKSGFYDQKKKNLSYTNIKNDQQYQNNQPLKTNSQFSSIFQQNKQKNFNYYNQERLQFSQVNGGSTISQKQTDPFIMKKIYPQNNYKDMKIVQKKQILQKPVSAFYLFLKQKRDTITKQYPQLSPQQMAQVMEQIWKGLTTQQKAPYQRVFNQNKLDYNKKLREQLLNTKDNK